MSIYNAIKRFKNRLFYGSDVSPLEYKDNKGHESNHHIKINIDGENDDLSNNPFYGDKAIKKRIEKETTNV